MGDDPREEGLGSVTREEYSYLVGLVNLGAWVVSGALLLAIVCWQQALRNWRCLRGGARG